MRQACLTVDLLSLQHGAFSALGLVALPDGDYGQIRMRLTDASLVIGGEPVALRIPSSKESGLKVNGGFKVVSGEITTLTIDFDAARSVHRTGEGDYVMRPVIHLAKEERVSAGVLAKERRDTQDEVANEGIEASEERAKQDLEAAKERAQPTREAEKQDFKATAERAEREREIAEERAERDQEGGDDRKAEDGREAEDEPDHHHGEGERD